MNQATEIYLDMLQHAVWWLSEELTMRRLPSYPPDTLKAEQYIQALRYRLERDSAVAAVDDGVIPTQLRARLLRLLDNTPTDVQEQGAKPDPAVTAAWVEASNDLQEIKAGEDMKGTGDGA